MAGDRDGSGQPGERRRRVVPRALAQRRAVGSLHDDEVGADLRDRDPTDRIPRLGGSASILSSWPESLFCSIRASSAETGSCHTSVTPASAIISTPATIRTVEIARSARLIDAASYAWSRAGFRTGFKMRARRCQPADVIAETGSYRRRADSVPPSEPGPAYDFGPRTVIGAAAPGPSPPARRTTTSAAAVQPSTTLQTSTVNNESPPPATSSVTIHANSSGSSPN